MRSNIISASLYDYFKLMWSEDVLNGGIGLIGLVRLISSYARVRFSGPCYAILCWALDQSTVPLFNDKLEANSLLHILL